MPGQYDDVQIKVFPSPVEFRAFDTQEEDSIAQVIRSEVLPREKADYYSVKVDVHRKADGKPEYLVAYMLRKDTYTADVVRVDVDEGYGIRGFQDDYREAEGEPEAGAEGEEEEPPTDVRAVAEEAYGAVEFVAATPCPEIPTALAAVEQIHEWAQEAGLNSVLLLGEEASVANYKKYLSSGLRGFVNVGHGNTNEIVLADGRLGYSWFNSLGRRLCPAVVYFNSCQVFNNPLQPAVMKAAARTFIGGIVNLGIGTFEEVCNCFWENVLLRNASMSILTKCEKDNYPTTGAHGISGDLGSFNFLTAVIDTYSVVLYGKDRTPESLVAFIHCYSGGWNVLSCEFYADDSAVPDNRYGGCRVGLAYPWSRFGAVIDVLRNEKPVYYGYIFSTKVGYLATQMEPVGEGEV
jgi:hypothetical protein